MSYTLVTPNVKRFVFHRLNYYTSIKMKNQKRERSSNFTEEETNILVWLAAKKRHIIENKKSDATTWQEKEKAWMDIEKTFNSASGSVFRSHKHLKLKYEAMKRDLRKKIISRADRFETGEGKSTTPPLTPAEEKVKQIILSVVGNESEIDSDLVLPSTSASNPAVVWMPVEEDCDQSATDQMMLIEDSSNNSLLEVKVKREKKMLPECESDDESQDENQWLEWDSTALKNKEHPVLSKPKENGLSDRVSEEELEIVKIKKKILSEELTQKIIIRKISEQELKHKAAIHELEKQQLLLKIELLKKELQKK